MQPLLAIVGPTASGKSHLAEELALRLKSSVVSVDAMQVYRGLDIGTAKEPPARRRCPLLMVDVCDPFETYSAQRFQEDARAVIDAELKAGRLPVLAGGTGLYLNAVIDVMDFPKGQIEDTRRTELEALAASLGPLAFHARLAEQDPQSAALIHPNNVRRVVRAFELLAEGKTYAEQHEGLHQRKSYYPCLIYGISRDREKLYERINLRVDQMIEEGLEAEARGLYEQGLADKFTAQQSIGYKEFIDYFEGHCSLDEAIAEIKKRTRRYAKRQLSWFGADKRVIWLDFETMDEDAAIERILYDLKSESKE